MEIGLIILLGVASGIIVNYLADVMPIFRKFTLPVCLCCTKPMGWGRYILMQPCQYCRARRRIRSFVTFVLLTVLITWMWFSPPARIGFWIGWLVLVYFFLVGIIDFEYRAILHPISAVGAGLGLLAGIFARGVVDTLLGGLAGAGIMLALYYFGILFIRLLSKARKQEIDEVALGFGDVILGGVLGLMVGWPQIIGAIISAILIAGLVSALMIIGNMLLRRYKALAAIPYAPFLIIGAAIFIFIPK